MTQPLLQIENLTFTYPEQAKNTLDGVSLAVERGKTALTGTAAGACCTNRYYPRYNYK